MGRKTEKRLAKMVMRLAKREAKAHRFLAEFIDQSENGWCAVPYDDWRTRVKAFLKDGMVDATD